METFKLDPNNESHDMQYMLDNGVVNQSEVAKVIEGRKLLMKKAEKNEVTQYDCFTQIDAELRLLDVCKLKSHQGLQDQDMKDIYDKVFKMLINRIDFLHFSMLQLFPIYLQHLIQYMNFRSINIPYIIDLTMLTRLMLKIHDDPEVYKTVALYEYNQMKNPDSARKCFLEGLDYHKYCKKLHMDAFIFEIQCIEDTCGESLSSALSTYKHIFLNVKGDLEFHFELLDTMLKLKKIWDLHYRVVKDMFKHYKHDERMWQKLAMINFDGFIFDQDLKLIIFDRDCKRRLSYFIKTFDECFKNEWIAKFVNENVERVFQTAYNEGILEKAEHFLYWLCKFYRLASHMSCAKISLIYRVKYLNWFGQFHDISDIRKLIKELVILQPPCIKLYIDMIYLEQTSSIVNLLQIKKLYDEVCTKLGHGDVELWASYIRFEYTHVERYKATRIYKSSLQYLGSELFKVLTAEFNNIKNNYEEANLVVNSEVINLDE